MPSAAALEPVDAAAVSTDTASLTASLELSSGTRQTPTRSGLWCRAVVGLRFLAAVAVFVPIFSVPLVLPLPKHGTCLGGWPEFVSVAQLQAHEAWARYVEGVYGSLPRHAGAYPLCVGELWLLYSQGLAAAGVTVDLDLPTSDMCPRDEGGVAGQRYEAHSTLAPPNTTWSWHPAPDGFAPLEAGAWVEVLHKGCAPARASNTPASTGCEPNLIPGQRHCGRARGRLVPHSARLRHLAQHGQ